jgi:transposase
MGVTSKTIRLWCREYSDKGTDGLRRKVLAPRKTKLSREQTDQILLWIDEGKDASGQAIRWTLTRLRYAIAAEFEISLGLTTIWETLNKENRKTLAIQSPKMTPQKPLALATGSLRQTKRSKPGG